MAVSLKERVEKLERQMAELSKALQTEPSGTRPVRKHWRDTFGMSANDPGFEEMIRLGREWRERQRPRLPRKLGKRDAGS